MLAKLKAGCYTCPSAAGHDEPRSRWLTATGSSEFETIVHASAHRFHERPQAVPNALRPLRAVSLCFEPPVVWGRGDILSALDAAEACLRTNRGHPRAPGL